MHSLVKLCCTYCTIFLRLCFGIKLSIIMSHSKAYLTFLKRRQVFWNYFTVTYEKNGKLKMF